MRTPIRDVRMLKVGDEVYVDGEIFTARDEAHKKMMESKEIPFDPSAMPLFHCGPVVKRVDGRWEVIAAGPTTSARMEIFEDKFIEKFKIKMIIGKGGMGERTLKALREHGAVYAMFTGGAGVLAARSIKRVKEVYWLEELGMPEAVWIFEVENFGPLVITMDSHGNSLHRDVRNRVMDRLKGMVAEHEG